MRLLRVESSLQMRELEAKLVNQQPQKLPAVPIKALHVMWPAELLCFYLFSSSAWDLSLSLSPSWDFTHYSTAKLSAKDATGFGYVACCSVSLNKRHMICDCPFALCRISLSKTVPFEGRGTKIALSFFIFAKRRGVHTPFVFHLWRVDKMKHWSAQLSANCRQDGELGSLWKSQISQALKMSSNGCTLRPLSLQLKPKECSGALNPTQYPSAGWGSEGWVELCALMCEGARSRWPLNKQAC